MEVDRPASTFLQFGDWRRQEHEWFGHNTQQVQISVTVVTLLIIHSPFLQLLSPNLPNFSHSHESSLNTFSHSLQTSSTSSSNETCTSLSRLLCGRPQPFTVPFELSTKFPSIEGYRG